jgi:hypothetical protein
MQRIGAGPQLLIEQKARTTSPGSPYERQVTAIDLLHDEQTLPP